VTEVHVLGGRRFHAADLDRRTVRMHHFLSAVTRDVGTPKRMPHEDEEPAAFMVEWNADVLASGQACRLLAAFLLPEGKTERDWSPDMAAETQAFLEQLDTEDDRELVDALVMECLVGFFQRALRPLISSLNSIAAQAVIDGQGSRSAAH
jgi:hypothetical protein